MPMLVRVETETGASLEEISDTQDVLICLSEGERREKLSVATMLDPWGNTTFNRLQIPLLLKDIRLLSARASPEERKTLGAIEALANRALAAPHLYLKFYGD